jgi:hypothetical protein
MPGVIQVEAALDRLVALDEEVAIKLIEIGTACNVLDVLQPEIDARRHPQRRQDQFARVQGAKGA